MESEKFLNFVALRFFGGDTNYRELGINFAGNFGGCGALDGGEAWGWLVRTWKGSAPIGSVPIGFCYDAGKRRLQKNNPTLRWDY